MGALLQQAKEERRQMRAQSLVRNAMKCAGGNAQMALVVLADQLATEIDIGESRDAGQAEAILKAKKDGRVEGVRMAVAFHGLS